MTEPSQPPPPTALAEWKAHWSKVLAGMAGMSFYAMVNYSFGQFIEPVQATFHWSRGGISLGLTIFNLLPVVCGPFMGGLIDRFGARRIGLPGTILSAGAFAALSLATGSLHQWYLLWLELAVFALAIKTTVWSVAISRLFTTSRGLALSLMLCGSALAQALSQLVSNALIVNYGWRTAYQLIGAGWGGLAVVLIALFFYDAPRSTAKAGSAEAEAAALPGLTIAEAARSPQIIRIGVANLLTSLAGSGVTVHMMPLLTQTGLARNAAAEIAAAAGISGIAGKLITGWLQDRYAGSFIPFSSYALAAIGYALLLNLFHTPVALTAGVMVLGYSAGAGLQVTTYLCTRYAGLKNFGKIYATIASMLMIGSSLGPWLAGTIHDRTGSYDALMLAAIPVVLVGALLMVGLGPYPRFARKGALA